MRKCCVLLTVICMIFSIFTVPVVFSADSNQSSAKKSEISAKDSIASVVDINTADEESLISLPGIGPKTAEKISQYRDENGPFETVDDLLNVKGIGPKVLEKLKPYITVS